MPDFAYVIIYVALSAFVVWLAMKLGKYVDLMDRKSNVSGAFIGGVLLAAVTSLPELFTSIAAVTIVKNNSLVVGNILGSNLVNLAFFTLIMLIFTRKFRSARFEKNLKITLIVTVVIYAMIAVMLYFADSMRVGWFNALSPIILAIYLLYVYRMPRSAEEEEDKSSADDNLTLKKIIIRFAICAVLLIGASLGITYTADHVAAMIGMNSVIAGALFLGVATSLPELISSITLCYRGNFNASAANIFGSNLFNFSIICLADFISFDDGASPMYELTSESLLLTMLCVASTVAVVAMLCLKERLMKKDGGMLGARGLTACHTLNLLPIAFYALFVVLPLFVTINV